MSEALPQPASPPEGALIDRVTGQFRELHRLSLADYDSYAELYRDYLSTGLELLDMEVGIVSRIADQTYTVLAVHPGDGTIATGDTFELGDTYCSRVISQAATLAGHDLSREPSWQAHPAYRRSPLGAYLAAPIWVEDSIYGTLNFTREAPRGLPFSEEDVELVDLMALGLGREIERDLVDQERARAAQRIHENAELFESAFRHAATGMALLATDGRWLRANRAVSQILGYTEDELLEVDFQTLTHPEDLDKDLEYVTGMLAGRRDTYRMEKRYFHRDGHTVWVLLSVSLARGEDGSARYFISQLQDITEQKRAEAELDRKRQELELANAKLRQLAMVDPLTRLLNRRAFTERLHAELNDCARTGMALSVVLADVDRFKAFNDDFGHPAGDAALLAVAGALTGASRANDVVARYGGEEFAMVLTHTDQPGSVVVAERMRRAISGITGLERTLSASFGCATVEPRRGKVHELDATALIRAADEALYAAKDAGRDRTIHARDLT